MCGNYSRAETIWGNTVRAVVWRWARTMTSLLVRHFFKIVWMILNTKFPQRPGSNHLLQPVKTVLRISGVLVRSATQSCPTSLIHIYFLLYFSLRGIYVPGCLHLWNEHSLLRSGSDDFFRVLFQPIRLYCHYWLRLWSFLGQLSWESWKFWSLCLTSFAITTSL